MTLKDRNTLAYKRRELSLNMQIDMGGGVISLVTNSLSDLNPNQKRELTATQEKEIFDNIVAALEWRGWIVDFVTGRPPR